MSNSNLVTYTKLSPNKTSPRNHAIDTITIHCVVGQLTAKQILNLANFVNYDSKNGSSCNYAIGCDGSIGLCVDEKDRSWCSSNRANDHRAITIEVASDTTTPYKVTDAAYKSLIKLCADVCKRNGIKELKWKANKSLIGQVNVQNMTVHRWFANKSCPGDYLYNLHGQIANEVNAILNGSSKKSITEIAKEVLAGKWGNGSERKNKLTQAGYDYLKVQNKVNELLNKTNTINTKPTQSINNPKLPFKVKVSIPDLNIRTGAGTTYAKTGHSTGIGIFTIVETKSGPGSNKGWGKLKSGAGWISLDYAKTI